MCGCDGAGTALAAVPCALSQHPQLHTLARLSLRDCMSQGAGTPLLARQVYSLHFRVSLVISRWEAQQCPLQCLVLGYKELSCFQMSVL